MNLETLTISKKTWKTFRGAAKNMGRFDEVCEFDWSPKTLDWLKRHPEYVEERIKTRIQ